MFHAKNIKNGEPLQLHSSPTRGRTPFPGHPHSDHCTAVSFQHQRPLFPEANWYRDPPGSQAKPLLKLPQAFAQVEGGDSRVRWVRELDSARVPSPREPAPHMAKIPVPSRLGVVVIRPSLLPRFPQVGHSP